MFEGASYDITARFFFLFVELISIILIDFVMYQKISLYRSCMEFFYEKVVFK